MPWEASNMSSSKRKLSSFVIANNDDLLIEIIARLPTKSLLRFKCVSKHWLSLISSPQFSRRLYPDSHLVSGLILHRSSFLINPEHDFVPLTNKPIIAPFKCLNFLKHPSGLRIQDSCHGLLCCSSFRDRHFKHDYYIYNPTTKQFVTLPPTGGRIIHGVTLAYDPVKSAHYKVVCVRSPDSFVSIDEDPYLSYQIEIYSSKTRSWRLSGDPFMAPVTTGFNGVFWNGAAHWIDCHYTSLHFKVDEEQLGEMPMPPSPIYPEDWEEGRRFGHFGESREHLHLVEIYGPCTTKFDVYEMQRDYSCWFVKYRIDLNAITMAFPEMIRGYLDVLDLNYYAFSILGLIREANDAGSYMVLHIPGKVIRYNLNDKTFDKICEIDPGRADIEGPHYEHSLEFFYGYQYTETLACV